MKGKRDAKSGRATKGQEEKAPSREGRKSRFRRKKKNSTRSDKRSGGDVGKDEESKDTVSTVYISTSSSYEYFHSTSDDSDTNKAAVTAEEKTDSSVSSIASSYQKQYQYSEPPPFSQHHPLEEIKEEDPNLQLQIIVLGFAFMAVWCAQNLMAPNLTQMALYFNFTPDQRDLYLGANIAFATGVLSFPVSAMLGFMADVVESRVILYAGTVFIGGVTSIATGYSKTYTQLYYSRFLCGACMSGSVPIVFSLQGDLFEAKDRNVASSAFMAMMGAGTLFGQVGAGLVGETLGWKLPFYVSGVFTIVMSFLVMHFVRDPVRGGKETVLQEMIARGTQYDRKLTAKGFWYAMTQNRTNLILTLYGLLYNLPWGVIYTFINDYFSQEQGLSVSDATKLILWFGCGMSVGGVAGGVLGGKAMAIRRSYLPLFMAVTTFVGFLPWLGLLDLPISGKNKWKGAISSFLAGVFGFAPFVNVRPCILNVNPPETRGAAMTLSNVMINLARGIGPSLVTMLQSFGYTRKYSCNLVFIVFYNVSTVLLLLLMKTFPEDQDAMDSELARYAEAKINEKKALLFDAVP